jgi:sugar phosphate isomerase/epimerase
MIEIAMSTLACPRKTLPEAVAIAEATGCDGIEFRTGGVRGLDFACDPFLSDEAKIRSLLDASGVKPVCVATGVRFDAVVFPPIVGQLFDNESSIREAKRAIDLAAQLVCPLVRVFGFEKADNESYKAAFNRIRSRLAHACDHARNTGTSVVLENGGDFSSAEHLAELIDAVSSPHLKASYDVAIGNEEGDCPAEAIKVLGNRLRLVRVKDTKGGSPVQLGTGDRPVETFVRGLAETNWDGSIVFEWEAAWHNDLAPIEEVLPTAVSKLCEWAGLASSAQAVA